MKAKRLFISVIALCCTMVAWAQNEAAVAILQKSNGEVKIYNGSSALQNAYNDAEETGSVITLSSGTFNSPGNIQKSVNIYGNGFEVNEQNGITTPTTISSGLNFSTGSDEKSLENFRIEGIYINGEVKVQQTKELVISKCRLTDFTISGNNVEALTIQQSLLTRSIQGSYYEIKGLTVKNSYIGYKLSASHENNRIFFDHCLLPTGAEGGHSKAVYTNCIFHGLYHASIATNSTVKHCILRDISVDGCIVEGNWTTDGTDIFEDGGYLENYYGCYYDASRTYKLKNPETYVGTDGTEVGIQGGMGFNKVPSTPVVKSLSPTVEGNTLKIDYEVDVR